MSGGAGNDTYVVDNSGDVVWELPNQGVDVIYASVSYTLSDNNIEALVLTGSDAINATGDSSNNYLIGNSGNNVLIGQEGADVLIGGLGQDGYGLYENTAANDTVVITTGDSLVNSYDWVTNFGLGLGLGTGNGTTGADRLDLDSTLIAANTASRIDGIDSGIMLSHSINNGIIRFSDNVSVALTITAANIADALGYLQVNISSGNTAAFISDGNTFVFQDGGSIDTLVELVGVTASSLSTTDLVAGSVWIV
jgi:hypothetical protein